jgi:hypothetical protein
LWLPQSLNLPAPYAAGPQDGEDNLACANPVYGRPGFPASAIPFLAGMLAVLQRLVADTPAGTRRVGTAAAVRALLCVRLGLHCLDVLLPSSLAAMAANLPAGSSVVVLCGVCSLRGRRLSDGGPLASALLATAAKLVGLPMSSVLAINVLPYCWRVLDGGVWRCACRSNFHQQEAGRLYSLLLRISLATLRLELGITFAPVAATMGDMAHLAWRAPPDGPPSRPPHQLAGLPACPALPLHPAHADFAPLGITHVILLAHFTRIVGAYATVLALQMLWWAAQLLHALHRLGRCLGVTTAPPTAGMLCTLATRRMGLDGLTDGCATAALAAADWRPLHEKFGEAVGRGQNAQQADYMLSASQAFDDSEAFVLVFGSRCAAFPGTEVVGWEPRDPNAELAGVGIADSHPALKGIDFLGTAVFSTVICLLHPASWQAELLVCSEDALGRFKSTVHGFKGLRSRFHASLLRTKGLVSGQQSSCSYHWQAKGVVALPDNAVTTFQELVRRRTMVGSNSGEG